MNALAKVSPRARMAASSRASPALAEPVAPMTSVPARNVKPRSCIRPRSADLGSWGAEADRFVCEIFISFSLICISFSLVVISCNQKPHVYKQTVAHPFKGVFAQDLHFCHLWRNRKYFAGPRRQRLRDLASQAGIAARFICKSVEDAELPRPSLIAYHFKVAVSFSASG